MILLQWLSLANSSGNQRSKRLTAWPSPLLVVEWSTDELQVSELSSGIGGWTQVQTFNISFRGTQAPSTPNSRGQLLRLKLDERGITTSFVIVAAPRNKAILRLFEQPDVAPEFVAGAVALQAESRGQSIDQYTIDYLSQPATPENLLHILSIAYPRQLLQEIEQTIAHAGLSLLSVGLGELALPRLAGPIDSPAIIIHDHGASIEIVVSRASRALTAINLALPNEPDKLPKFLAAALRRVIGAVPANLGLTHACPVYTTGARAAEFQQLLSNDNTWQVSAIEMPQHTNPLAWALAHVPPNDVNLIDLLHPRQSVAPQVPWQQRLRTWGLRAGLVLSLVVLLLVYWVTRLDERSAELMRSIRSNEQLLAGKQDTLDAYDRLRDWQESSVNWPDELGRFMEHLPDNKRVFLRQLHVENSLQQPPAIQAAGVARELDDAFKINHALIGDDDHYQLLPENIDRQRDDVHYKFSFEVQATLQGETATITSPGSEPREATP